MTPLGTYKLGSLVELCKSKLKLVTDKEIPFLLWKDYLNLASSELKELLGNKDFTDYKSNKNIFSYLAGVDANIQSATLPTFLNYKQIDNIYLLRDNVNGAYNRVNSEVEFFNIADPVKFSPNYAKQIFWTNSGDTLYIATGPNAIAIHSTITMHFIRNPIPMESKEDYVDVRDSNIRQLLDIVTLYALQKLNEPIPAVLNQVKQDIINSKQSSIEERQTILSERTDPK